MCGYGQVTAVVLELRGVGVAATKSLELTLVSVQPLPFRIAARMLLGAGVGPVPSKVVAVPYPTKSTMLEPTLLEPVRAVVVLTRATLPAVPAIASVPVASGVGRAGNVVAPPAC